MEREWKEKTKRGLRKEQTENRGQHSGFACGNRAKNQSFQKPLKLKPFKDTSLTMMYANL